MPAVTAVPQSGSVAFAYLYDYLDGSHARERLDWYFRFYNTERRHQALGKQAPEDVYRCAA